MNDVIETAKEHCHHPDCIYRQYIEGGHLPICGYAAVEGKSRGCKISECDKYTPGDKVKARMRQDVVIFWECELYGNATDVDL